MNLNDIVRWRDRYDGIIIGHHDQDSVYVMFKDDYNIGFPLREHVASNFSIDSKYLGKSYLILNLNRLKFIRNSIVRNQCSVCWK